MFSRRKPNNKIERQLRKRVDELEQQNEAKDRIIATQQVELDSLAAVVARDRERVKAETAEHARRRAEAEGTNGPTQSRTS